MTPWTFRNTSIPVNTALGGLIFCALLLPSCAPSVDPADIYHHISEYKGSEGSRNIEVWEEKGGSLSARALGKESSIPALLFNSATYYPDALDSRNIQILVKDLGYTHFAGLKWTQAITVNIWADGIIEVDRENISTLDAKGTAWISRKVRVGSKRAIIMIRKK